MPIYLIMCRSLTYAQRAARRLESSGITATVARAPQGVVTEGCTYCVKVSEKRLYDALNIMRSSGITPGKVFLSRPDGELREVRTL